MVHKKYIIIKGKKYGPYYYQSYRDKDGRVKKRYIKFHEEDESKRRLRNREDGNKNILGIVGRKMFERNVRYFVFLDIAVFALILSLLMFSFLLFSAPLEDKIRIGEGVLLAPPLGASSVVIGDINLSIWDITDDGNVRFSGDAVQFYANFTRESTKEIIDNTEGNCVISYNFGTGFTAPQPMIYNPVNELWEAVQTFNYKGNNVFDVSCSSPSFGDADLQNGFVITNTPPSFDRFGLTLNGQEDTIFTYDYRADVSDPDANSILVFTISEITDLLGNVISADWISIESDTGILTIDADVNQEAGRFVVSVFVADESGDGEARSNTFVISEFNDVPQFLNLENKEFNMSFLFSYDIFAVDEENDFPLVYNISFANCQLAQWSTRTDCVLFDENDFITGDGGINISFIPTKNDVGFYEINFTVRDTNNAVMPYNATTEVFVNFSVLNINDPPYFRYVCDNERAAVENTEFNCYINASDLDEINNLTFRSNESWFLNFANATVNSMTEFNGSAQVNFTPTDREVGNWLINISVFDTGSPRGVNSTVIPFFVDNVADNVRIHALAPFTAYTTTTLYSLYVNATDDDLLIPDKSVYNEVLSFASNESWLSVNVFQVIAGTNRTVGLIEFDPNSIAIGLHHVNISATDFSGNIDSFIFEINIEGNTAPVWDIATPIVHVLQEDIVFNLNLSQYISDADGDAISFSFGLEPGIEFANFNIDNLGVIDFIPLDADVGQHIVQINASDGKIETPLMFNFSVYNLNDAPVIEYPLSGNSNVTIELPSSNMRVFEDDNSVIFLHVDDDDLRIPQAQKGFYNEFLNIDLNITGINENLFEFIFDGPISEDKNLYTARFTPRKADVGFYNIYINASDSGNLSSFINFNLTVLEINHAPVLMNLSEQGVAVNTTLFYDINASDLEDGIDSDGNLRFTIEFLPDGRADDFYLRDENVFNSTTGLLNVDFDDSNAGAYHLNMSVSDTVGLKDYGDFWIYVYDAPVILSPDASVIFNLREGVGRDLFFRANSSAGGNLTYEFYIGENLRYKTRYYGDGRDIVWNAIPAFVDETYGLFGNLTLVVSVNGFEYLYATRNWRANITHSNAPMRLVRNIGDKEGSAGGQILVNLSEHFVDEDVFDLHYNQSFIFEAGRYVNNSFISVRFEGWHMIFESPTLAKEVFNVTGSDFGLLGERLTSSTSNNFTIEFKAPVVVQVPVPVPVPTSGGGGGGSTTERPVSLRLLLPDPVSAFKGQTIVLPIGLLNDGPVKLNRISLSSLIAKDGLLREDLKMSFNRDFIQELDIGDREDVILTVELGSVEQGLYEITVNADVEDPDYSDWGKIFINVQEGKTVVERLVFTEEFITENPECAEIKELVDESRELLVLGDFENADRKLNDAVEACKQAISQESLFTRGRFRERIQDSVFLYLLIATIVSVVLGIAYYFYRIVLFRKALKESMKNEIGEIGKF